MQQRRLRLGDILDDYCPRERRITNHAVVAMIEDDVKQTRCTTCDTEHEYKQARMPTLRRKKDSVGKAYKEVLAAVTADAPMQAAQAAARSDAAPTPQLDEDLSPPLLALAEDQADDPEAAAEAPGDESGQPALDEEARGEAGDNEGRVHRRLIRATLPRTENQVTPRPIPQFTMRQPQGRPGKFRAGGGRGPGAVRGGAAGRGGMHSTNSSPRAAGARGAGGRAQGGRPDFARSTRGGQPARQGKKHSK